MKSRIVDLRTEELISAAETVRENAAVSGVRQAARNLKKQGVPIEYALAMLAGRASA